MTGPAETSSSPPNGSAKLSALADRLWCADGSPALVTSGHLPADHVQVARYSVLPNLTAPQMLVPDDTGTARAALTAYSALRRPRARLGRRLLAGGMLVGGGPLLMRHHLTVGVPREMRTDALSHILPELRVAASLGRGDVRLAIGIREPTSHFKPTLQVFVASHELVGFAKVGWSPMTNERIRAEIATLRRLTAHPPRSYQAPAVLATRHDSAGELSVVRPLPPRSRRHDPFFAPPPARVLLEIAALAPTMTTPLAASPYLAGLRERLSHVAPSRVLVACTALLDRMVERSGTSQLRLGAWHGDLVPWNVAEDGGQLVVWDWEYSAMSAPIGFDLLHWLVQARFARGDLDLAAAVATTDGTGGPQLAELGVPHALHAHLLNLYLVEICVRELELNQANGAPSSRWLDQAGPVLYARETDQ